MAYKAHARRDVTAKGAFIFRKTGVEYAHDGIKNLRHRVSLNPQAWITEFSSGAFTMSYPLDGSTSRLPVRATCGTVGVVKLYQRFQLPPDFGSFQADAFEVYTRRNQAITHLTATLIKAGVTDAGINGDSVSPASDATWELFPLTPGTTYSPRDWLTLVIEFSADTIGDYVEVADVGFEYVTGRGHAL